MQWYERNHPFYQRRFIRETDFVAQHNLKVYNDKKLRTGFLDNGDFYIIYPYSNVKPFKRVHFHYPKAYPHEEIVIFVSEIDIKTESFIDWEELKVYVKTTPEIRKLTGGFHLNEGLICYHHNEWDENWGIEVLLETANQWFTSGRYIGENDRLFPSSNNLTFLLPELEHYNFKRSWGVFDYFYINKETCCIEKFYYSDQVISLKEEFLSDCISTINIPKSYKLKKKKVLKGVFIVSDLDIFNNERGKFVIFKRCLANSFPKGLLGFWEFLEKENIAPPYPLLILNKTPLYKGVFIENKNKDKEGESLVDLCKVDDLIINKYEHNERKRNEKLLSKKIAILGAGAIGSIMATELVRNGLCDILLVDPDRLEVKNIHRHDLTLKDVGKYKVEALRDKLLDINPKMNCSISTESATNKLKELLNYDLIISTIDNECARQGLNAFLIPKRKKIVYVGAFYNSIAGFAFLAEKGQTCYRCFAEQLDNMANSGLIPNFYELTPKDIVYSCGSQPSYPGCSVYTHLIALMASKFVLDLLSKNREENANGFFYNFYLLGNEEIEQNGKKFFGGLFNLQKDLVKCLDGCLVCNPEEVAFSESEKEDYQSRLSSLKNFRE